MAKASGKPDGSRQGGGGLGFPPLTSEEKIIAFIVVFAAAVALILYSDQFFSSPSSALCSKILYAQQRYACFGSLALSTGNSSMCLHMPASQGDRCVVAVAENLSDPYICRSIHGTSLYADCVMNISYSTRSFATCANLLSGSNRTSCIYRLEVAGNFANKSACGLMADPYASANCTYLHYYYAALSTGNSSYCGFVSSANVTLLEAAAFGLGSAGAPAASEGISLNSSGISSAGYCYYAVASKTGNASLCARIPPGYIQDKCYSSLSHTNSSIISPSNQSVISENASTFCSSEPPSLMGFCSYEFLIAKAVALKEPTICNSINNSQYLYTCFTTYAVKSGNYTYCYDITNSSARYGCLLSMNTTAAQG